jgi:hypothetical protein
MLLTEKEMNEIGAKIVKAEILGNDVSKYIFKRFPFLKTHCRP